MFGIFFTGLTCIRSFATSKREDFAVCSTMADFRERNASSTIFYDVWNSLCVTTVRLYQSIIPCILIRINTVGLYTSNQNGPHIVQPAESFDVELSQRL